MLRHLIGFVVVLGCLFTLSATTATAVPLDPLDASISGDLQLYYRSDVSGGTLGQPLDQWDDLSGNGFHATSAGTLRPVLTASVTAGGDPAIRFNGDNDAMLVTEDSVNKEITSLLINDHTKTVFAVAQWHVASQEFERVLTAINGSSSSRYGIQQFNGGEAYGYFQSGGVQASGGTITANDFDVITTINNGASGLALRVDGTQVGTAGASSNSTLGLTTVGNGTYNVTGPSIDGDIVAIMIYDSVLTTPQIEGVEEFLTLGLANGFPPIPEPTSGLLLGLGLVGLAGFGRRRKVRS